jgi:hypothetical protein
MYGLRSIDPVADAGVVHAVPLGAKSSFAWHPISTVDPDVQHGALIDTLSATRPLAIRTQDGFTSQPMNRLTNAVRWCCLLVDSIRIWAGLDGLPSYAWLVSAVVHQG